MLAFSILSSCLLSQSYSILTLAFSVPTPSVPCLFALSVGNSGPSLTLGQSLHSPLPIANARQPVPSLFRSGQSYRTNPILFSSEPESNQRLKQRFPSCRYGYPVNHSNGYIRGGGAIFLCDRLVGHIRKYANQVSFLCLDFLCSSNLDAHMLSYLDFQLGLQPQSC